MTDVGIFEPATGLLHVFPNISRGKHFALHIRQMQPSQGVDERAFRFLCDVIGFVRTIGPEPGIRRLVDQLVASTGSIAANRQEATSASSRREFVRFNEIALRSAKETALWLRVFTVTGIGDRGSAPVLLGEAQQLTRIIAAIVIRAKENPMDE